MVGIGVGILIMSSVVFLSLLSLVDPPGEAVHAPGEKIYRVTEQTVGRVPPNVTMVLPANANYVYRDFAATHPKGLPAARKTTCVQYDGSKLCFRLAREAYWWGATVPLVRVARGRARLRSSMGTFYNDLAVNLDHAHTASLVQTRNTPLITPPCFPWPSIPIPHSTANATYVFKPLLWHVEGQLTTTVLDENPAPLSHAIQIWFAVFLPNDSFDGLVFQDHHPHYS